MVKQASARASYGIMIAHLYKTYEVVQIFHAVVATHRLKGLPCENHTRHVSAVQRHHMQCGLLFQGHEVWHLAINWQVEASQYNHLRADWSLWIYTSGWQFHSIGSQTIQRGVYSSNHLGPTLLACTQSAILLPTHSNGTSNNLHTVRPWVCWWSLARLTSHVWLGLLLRLYGTQQAS